VSRKRVVVLSEAERVQLHAVLREPSDRRRRIRARVLLLASEGHSDEAIAAEVQADRSTVERTRRRFVENGLTAALTDRPRPGATPVLDASSLASLAELAGSNPPAGRAWWTMQLLADELVRRGVVAKLSDESVRRALHKMGLLATRPDAAMRRRRAHRSTAVART
jgi:transposase